MANLWQTDPESGQWLPHPLGTASLRISASGTAKDSVVPTPTETIELIRYQDELSGRARWVLLVGLDAWVRVNGARVTTGIRSVRDRDAIQVNGGPTFFFSTEQLPRVESFPSGLEKTLCRRCLNEIPSGAPATKCPLCGTWHHELPERLCWSSVPRCSVCEGATAGLEYSWTPAAL